MDFFIQRFIKPNFALMFSVFYFLPFPAFSATFITSFTLLNLVFVFGLCLPIFIISFFLKSKSPFKLRYYVLLIISILGLICSITYIEYKQEIMWLIFSVVFMVSLYFCVVSRRIEPAINLTMTSNAVVLILTSTYILSVWYFPHFQIMWGLLSAIILIISAIRIKYSSKTFTSFLYRIVMHWSVIFYFSVIVYLQITNEISDNIFVGNSVICFTILAISGCLTILKDFATAKNIEVRHVNQINDAVLSEGTLTNLPSQQQAMKSINKLFKSNSNDNFVVITFKPINFTQVNKVLGHHNSDILLLQLAYCLQKSVEGNKSLVNFNNENFPIRIARLQGLHFLVVLQLKTDETNSNVLIEQVSQNLILAVPNAMSFKSFSLNFELTFGISFLDDYENNISQSISHSEDALLSAENNQLPLCYFDKKEVMYTERHLLDMELLKNDIIDDNLHWYVQPQTRLRDRKLVGFELLVHWYNNKEKPLELQEFIDTAEHSGEIYLLTKQMITHAFKLILQLQRISNYETVSIKLLSQYLLEPNLVSFIEKQIETYNVPAKFLVIELPEQVVLCASERAKSTIDELKSLNVNIGISDFSGSYESLRYIRKMAVHQVKIDCQHIGKNEDDSENAIVTSLIDLTKKMNLRLIGTLINNKQTEQSFTLIGGELAQGNIIDKGVAKDKIGTWVTTWNGLYNPA